MSVDKTSFDETTRSIFLRSVSDIKNEDVEPLKVVDHQQPISSKPTTPTQASSSGDDFLDDVVPMSASVREKMKISTKVPESVEPVQEEPEADDDEDEEIDDLDDEMVKPTAFEDDMDESIKADLKEERNVSNSLAGLKWPWQVGPVGPGEVAKEAEADKEIEASGSEDQVPPDWTWLIKNFGRDNEDAEPEPEVKMESRRTTESGESDESGIDLDVTPFTMTKKKPEIFRNEFVEARTERFQEQEEKASSIFPEWFLSALSNLDVAASASPPSPTTPETTPTPDTTTTTTTTSTTTITTTAIKKKGTIMLQPSMLKTALKIVKTTTKPTSTETTTIATTTTSTTTTTTTTTTTETTTTTITTTTTEIPTTTFQQETTTEEDFTTPPITTTSTTTTTTEAPSSPGPETLKKSSLRLQQSDTDDNAIWKRPVPKVVYSEII